MASNKSSDIEQLLQIKERSQLERDDLLAILDACQKQVELQDIQEDSVLVIRNLIRKIVNRARNIKAPNKEAR